VPWGPRGARARGEPSLVHLQFEWENQDDDFCCEGHLSIHTEAVPRLGDEISVTYKDDNKLPELTTVRGKVECIRWEYDCSQPKPDADVYPHVYLKDVTTKKWTP